jgi:hypothetical protein
MPCAVSTVIARLRVVLIWIARIPMGAWVQAPSQPNKTRLHLMGKLFGTTMHPTASRRRYLAGELATEDAKTCLDTATHVSAVTRNQSDAARCLYRVSMTSDEE